MEQGERSRSSSFLFREVTPAGVLLAIVLFLIIIYVFGELEGQHRLGRRAAAYSMCQKNLRDCAAAVHLYARDYDNRLPSSAVVHNSSKWNRQDFISFATRIGTFPVPDGSRPRTWPQLIYPYIDTHEGCRDSFFCPRDNVERDSPRSRTSYYWKTAIDMAWYGHRCVRAHRTTNDFPHQADQILIYERRGWHLKESGALREGVQISVVYMDTHVARICVINASSGSPTNCAADSDGEPMYFNYDTKTGKALPKNMPATYIDPGRYVDEFH